MKAQDSLWLHPAHGLLTGIWLAAGGSRMLVCIGIWTDSAGKDWIYGAFPFSVESDAFA